MHTLFNSMHFLAGLTSAKTDSLQINGKSKWVGLYLWPMMKLSKGHWVLQGPVSQNPQLNLRRNSSTQLSVAVPRWLDSVRKRHCHVSDPNRKSKEGHLTHTYSILHCSHLHFRPSHLSWPQWNCLLSQCWIFLLQRAGVWLDGGFPVWGWARVLRWGLGWVYS